MLELEDIIIATLRMRTLLDGPLAKADSISASSLVEAMIANYGEAFGDREQLTPVAAALLAALYDPCFEAERVVKLGKATPDFLRKSGDALLAHADALAAYADEKRDAPVS